MSLAVQLTSDKTRFVNYFSEPLTLSSHTQVALTKCSGSIPTIVTQTIRIPYIDPAVFNNEDIVTAIVDGVTLNITWQDFYNAWADNDNNIEESANIDIDAFYSGRYELYLNNYIRITDANGVVFYKTSFEEILIDALNAKFEFYFFENESNYNVNRVSDVYSIDAILAGVGELNANIVEPVKQTSITNIGVNTFKITATYNADAISLRVPTGINFVTYPAQSTGWTTGNGTLTNATGTKALAVANPFWKIDRNGGYVQWRYTHTGTGAETTYAGLCETAGEIDAAAALSQGFDTTLPCLAVKYSSAAANTFTIQEYGVDKSLPISYDAADFIFMRCFRTNDVGPEKNSFVLQVWQGGSGTLLPNKLIYTSGISLKTGFSPQPFFYDDGKGNLPIASTFTAIRYIAEGEQTAMQDATIGDPQSQSNLFKIETIYDVGVGDLSNFYSSIGIPITTGNGGSVSEQDGNGLIHSLEWKPNPLPRLVKKYMGVPSGANFVKGSINNLLVVGAPGVDFAMLKWKSVSPYIVEEIPRLFEFHIQDLAVKNFEGSYIAGERNYTTGAMTRCVGTISVPKEYFDVIDNFNLNFDYEPYNLIYRQINNPENFAINQMRCQLSYKDFITNELQSIETINGTLKTELHFEIQDKSDRGHMDNGIKPF